jgi:molybdate transport system substrate-binding protein
VRRAILVLLLPALVAGCGDDATVGDGGGSGTGGGGDALVVSAASSLKEAFTACGAQFGQAKVQFQFAGSDELAAQIRQGAPVDVFAAANTSLPEALAQEGKLEQPENFATNRLVLAVPADSDIASVDDLVTRGVKLVVGAEGVPVGDYTRKVLGNLGAEESAAILANVRSNEPDVKGVVGKLTQGAADAGFVYASDAKAAGDDIKAVEIPDELEPTATYAAGVVKDAPHADAAQAFLDDVQSGACHDALLKAGFGAP